MSSAFGGTMRSWTRQPKVTRGMLVHYEGARLPDRWYWVSANQFDDSDLMVDALVAHSRVWGVPGPRLWMGYLAIERAGVLQLVVFPLTGLITVAEPPDGWDLLARPLVGSATRVRCSAPPAAYNDLGEGIRQTLLGTISVEQTQGVVSASGTAGLERRN